MNNSNSSPDSKQPRVTLKLKIGARKAPGANETAPTTPQTNSKQKAGAHWSDEYKERMQAEMDSLLR